MRHYLGITAQRKLPIVLPPYEVQLKIAKCCGVLDDKIYQNQKINDHFPLYFYLLQSRQGLYTQPAWAAACEVPGVGAGAAGSLTSTAELFRFWVFPDCTFLDISR